MFANWIRTILATRIGIIIANWIGIITIEIIIANWIGCIIAIRIGILIVNAELIEIVIANPYILRKLATVTRREIKRGMGNPLGQRRPRPASDQKTRSRGESIGN